MVATLRRHGVLLVVAALAAVLVVALSAGVAGARPRTSGSLAVVAPVGAPGAPLEVTGRFPTEVRRPVLLQRLQGASWVTIALTRTNRDGVFAAVTVVPSSGVELRARAPRTSEDGRSYRSLVTPTRSVIPSAAPAPPTVTRATTATVTATATQTQTATQTVTQTQTTTATVTAPPSTTTATVTASPSTTTATVTAPPSTTTATVTSTTTAPGTTTTITAPPSTTTSTATATVSVIGPTRTVTTTTTTTSTATVTQTVTARPARP